MARILGHTPDRHNEEAELGGHLPTFTPCRLKAKYLPQEKTPSLIIRTVLETYLVDQTADVFFMQGNEIALERVG